MYVEKLLDLATKLKTQQSIEEFTENVNMCFNYINVVSQIMLESITGNKNVSTLEMLNDRRNREHDKLCLALHEINIMAKERGVEPFFDIQLNPVIIKGIKGFDSQTHHQSASIASIIVEELAYLSKHTIKELDKAYQLQDELTEQATKRYFENMSFEQLIKKMEMYNDKYYGLDDWLKQNQEQVITVDIGNKKMVSMIQRDKYSIDIVGSNSNELGELQYYLDNSGCGTDIPISAIKDFMNENNGFKFIGAQTEAEYRLQEFIKSTRLIEQNEMKLHELDSGIGILVSKTQTNDIEVMLVDVEFIEQERGVSEDEIIQRNIFTEKESRNITETIQQYAKNYLELASEYIEMDRDSSKIFNDIQQCQEKQKNICKHEFIVQQTNEMQL